MALDRDLSLEVFRRDGWRCRHCKSSEGLHPHHLKYKSQQGPDELWNLITLCFKCHRAHHDGKLRIVFEVCGTETVVKFTRVNNWKP
jgi:5-methylcytosine-specific restriction endonuclease McrA